MSCRREILKGWAPAVALLAVVAGVVLLLPYLSPVWSEPGHREIVMLFAAIVVVAIKLLVTPDIRAAVKSVTADMLVQVRASDAWERSVNEKLTRLDGTVSGIRDRLERTERDGKAETEKIRRHLASMPHGLRLPVDEA